MYNTIVLSQAEGYDVSRETTSSQVRANLASVLDQVQDGQPIIVVKNLLKPGSRLRPKSG
ncbi:MAG: type II toxin-antitoxin system prevent-host-death family antitoxin [Moorea sp. SIO4G3]|nr:type II toxin-antitoxin system prevent-host-death family antitoxin [Moorena sp. SIO4G3]